MLLDPLEEGKKRDRTAMVGHTMIDSLFSLLPAAQATGAVPAMDCGPPSTSS